MLRDRHSVGGFAGLIAILLLLQGLLAGMAQGAMAAAAVDPLHVICSVEGAVPVDGGDTPLRKAADCPCGTLCQLASAFAPVLPGDQPGLILAEPREAGRLAFSPTSPSHASLRGLIAEARAPPTTSV